MTRSAIAASLLTAVVILSSCGRQPQPEAPQKSAKPDEKAGIVTVTESQKPFIKVEAVGSESNRRTIESPGRIAFHPHGRSLVGSTVSGRVAAILVRNGDRVRAGTPLFVVESADAAAVRATLDLAATRLASAESVYRRHVEMMEKGVGLEVERHDAETRLREARSEHDRARHAAGLIGGNAGPRVTVPSPVSGVVVAIRSAVGATVAPGSDPLIEVGDLARLQAVAYLTETEIGSIRPGQSADVEIPALRARVSATVDSVSPNLDADSRRAPVYLVLNEKVAGLSAGMLTNVAMHAVAKGRVTLPVSAVIIKDGRRRVVFAQRTDGRFEPRTVQTGETSRGRIEIVSGVEPGERIVTEGALLLDAEAEQLL